MGKGIDDTPKADVKVIALVGTDPGPQGAGVKELLVAVAALEARIAAIEAKVGI